MSESIRLILTAAAGSVLGAFFFGGLWWTVRRALTSHRPTAWFLGSLLLRVVITLSGFYLLGGGHWQRLGLCLLGFIAARWVMHWVTRTPIGQPPGRSHAVTHAP